MPVLRKASNVVRNYMSQFQKYLTLTFIVFCGCNNASTTINSNDKGQSLWTSLSIRTNSNDFSIHDQNDSLIINSFPISVDTKDSILSFKITSSEKDSLFKWTESLIDNKIKPKHFCTDYYGTLYIKVTYNDQMTKTANYTSICEWKDLDSNCSKIYLLINKATSQK